MDRQMEWVYASCGLPWEPSSYLDQPDGPVESKVNDESGLGPCATQWSRRKPIPGETDGKSGDGGAAGQRGSGAWMDVVFSIVHTFIARCRHPFDRHLYTGPLGGRAERAKHLTPLTHSLTHSLRPTGTTTGTTTHPEHLYYLSLTCPSSLCIPNTPSPVHGHNAARLRPLGGAYAVIPLVGIAACGPRPLQRWHRRRSPRLRPRRHARRVLLSRRPAGMETSSARPHGPLRPRACATKRGTRHQDTARPPLGHLPPVSASGRVPGRHSSSLCRPPACAAEPPRSWPDTLSPRA